MNREIVWTTQFKKDDKLAMKRHMDMDLLDHIIRALSRGETLPERNKDHSLTGDWVQRMSHSAGLAFGLPHGGGCAGADLGPHRDTQRFVWQIIRYRRMGSKTSCTAVSYPQGKGKPPGNWGDSGAFPGGHTLCASAAALHDSEKFAP